MHIKGIIRHLNYHSYCYDTSAITLADVLSSQDGTQQVILCLERDEGSILFVDLMKLYAEQPVSANGVVDWDTMLAYLTNLDTTVLVRYKTTTLVPYRMLTIQNNVKTYITTPFYTDITTTLNIYSVENNFGIDVGYDDLCDFLLCRRAIVEVWACGVVRNYYGPDCLALFT